MHRGQATTSFTRDAAVRNRAGKFLVHQLVFVSALECTLDDVEAVEDVKMAVVAPAQGLLTAFGHLHHRLESPVVVDALAPNVVGRR